MKDVGKREAVEDQIERRQSGLSPAERVERSMSQGRKPEGRRAFLRQLTAATVTVAGPLGSTSCAPLLSSPEWIAQRFVKAYLEADVDRVNKYLSDTFGAFYELG